jgi:hypothetical protein
MISSPIVNVALALVSTLGERPTEQPAVPDDAGRSTNSPAASETRAACESVEQDPNSTSPSTPAEKQTWTFDAFVYYWSAGVSGNLTVDGQDIDLEGGGDGFSGETALSGFLGHFEAHHGPWSFALAPIFVNVDMTGEETGGVDAAVKISAQVHEGFVAHEIGHSWDWLAGARYYGLDTEIDLSVGGVPTGSLDSNHSWVDPIVGVRYHDDFGEHWTIHTRADVGGFGVGSDFAWNASALLGYRFNSCCAAHLGYRALSVDFKEGSGSDRLAYDLSMYGPILGVSFSF